jgi:hypothetical protein
MSFWCCTFWPFSKQMKQGGFGGFFGRVGIIALHFKRLGLLVEQA